MTDLDHQPANNALPQSDMDVETESSDRSLRTNGLRTIAFVTGSIALVLAMATDALAVAGRHLGLTVLGAIEIVQACVVVAATSAIVVATIDNTHARVRILLEQVSAATAAMFERFADVLSALVCLALVAGSVWLASDLWNGQELTEVLGIPLRWLRLFWIIGSLVAAIMFVAPLGRRRK